MYVVALDTEELYGKLDGEFNLKRIPLCIHEDPIPTNQDRFMSRYVRDIFYDDLYDRRIGLFDGDFLYADRYFVVDDHDYDPLILKLSLPSDYTIHAVFWIEYGIYVDYYRATQGIMNSRNGGDGERMDNDSMVPWWTGERLAGLRRVL